MVSARDLANRPVYINTAGDSTLHLYLPSIGEWGSDARAVKSIKRYLRERGFTIDFINRLGAQYGVGNIPCVQFRCSGRLDRELKLTQDDVAKLQKLAHTSCTAMGQAAATAIYLDGEHLNTKVVITVHEGAVTTPETHYPFVSYDISRKGNTYSFYLARPVGREPEDPAHAATIVAQTLGIYTPNRITPATIRRQDVVVRGGYGDAELNYM